MNQIELINRISDISIQLSNEKDVDRLLQIILESCIDITVSDAGSIYIVDEDELIFKYTVNNSITFPFKEFKMNIDKNSIAGNCVLNKELYNIKDMKDTWEMLRIKHNQSFDKSVGYKTMNMLVIPMENYKGEIIGVLQLINKKESTETIITDTYKGDVIPYTSMDETLTSSLASQAAILIERTRLQTDLSNLLDSMIITLSTALEQRDPITAGHSARVTEYATLLAKEVNNDKRVFSNVFFDEDELKELQIASLLHDVGKIGVPERVLQKKNRLTDEKLNEILMRLYLYSLQTESKNIAFDFESTKEKLIEINSGNFLTDESLEFLQKLHQNEPFVLFDKSTPLLSDYEFQHLSVKKGNLTEKERESINDHAQFSKDILSRIKWGKLLKNVPVLASRHHEKLNGKGYPLHLNEANLSILDRILPIVDIYDALTAKDRPYKPAMSKEKALEILGFEVQAGALDEQLVELFKNRITEDTSL